MVSAVVWIVYEQRTLRYEQRIVTNKGPVGREAWYQQWCATQPQVSVRLSVGITLCPYGSHTVGSYVHPLRSYSRNP
jgi:hypothetical protein